MNDCLSRIEHERDRAIALCVRLIETRIMATGGNLDRLAIRRHARAEVDRMLMAKVEAD